MAVSSIKKIRILAHSAVREKIINDLQSHGVVQIVDLKERLGSGEYEEFFPKEEIAGEELKTTVEELEEAIDYLSPFQPKKGFLEKLVGAKLFISLQRVKTLLKTLNYKEVCSRCAVLKRKKEETERQESALEREREEVLPWSKFPYSPKSLGPTRQTNSLLGLVPAGQFDSFAEEIKEKAHLEIIDRTTSGVYFFLVYLKQDKEEFSEILKRHTFHSPPFTFSSTPAGYIKELTLKLAKIAIEKQTILNELEKLSSRVEELMVVYDWFLNSREKETIRNSFLSTRESFMLEGWLKKRDSVWLKKVIEDKYPASQITILDPERGELPPVALENQGVFKPFEMVTRLYGLPQYKAVDPTVLLAPFFFLFFGLCLTDAGYGIVLMILSLLCLKKLKAGRNFFRLLFLCGLGAFFAGIFTGGWFGIESEKLPLQFKNAILFNPLKEPMVFFYLALGLGFLQVWFGIVVNLYTSIRDSNYYEAIFSQGSWMFIMSGILTLILGKVLHRDALGELSKFLLLFGVLNQTVLRAVFSKRKLAGLGMGLIYLLDGAKNLLGNVLSYSRLMALGLCTGVIGMVVNIIALLVIQLIPVAGWILGFIILLGGHVFNIAISSLGAFVHTARLQFVEFFPYFFKGGGEEFRPFRPASRYTVVS